VLALRPSFVHGRGDALCPPSYLVLALSPVVALSLSIALLNAMDVMPPIF
jgi:hypothetical protein